MGGATLSKNSFRLTSKEQRFWHNGVGLGVAPTAESPSQRDASSSPKPDPVRAIALEEAISLNATMPAAINKITPSTFCNRLKVNERLTVSTLAAGV